ncbi:energy-coupling factor transporter transmembrane component T family protein [Gleimia hominis]|uniref:energy-coupling factor transporter transmembrane component T family protein n=1 Tax=Gleimia hominis TaxID=595468 RepID=UPI000C80E193|nr:energy-coupling factor transporter transmembrane component T [Gleimia hominis]WIK63769.1 energy-coupling factor transporter transmembrane component T [Gleimia hominis]
MSTPILGYVNRPGLLHRLAGTSKLVFVAALVVAAMITFDVRLLATLAAINLVAWALSRIKLADLKLVLGIITGFMLLNIVLIYVFAPEYGVELFGTRHAIWDGPGRWSLTWEQIFYEAAVALKYFAVLPSVLLFITTTRPPEFASSLNSVGVPYRFAYAVSLSMRYIPDVQRDFNTISKAQQARGMDTSSDAPLRKRVRNLVSILMPLLLSSLDRIESVASAMELRGFGREKRRTWYARRQLRFPDWLLIGFSALLLAGTIALWFVNHGRFWNPFI